MHSLFDELISKATLTEEEDPESGQVRVVVRLPEELLQQLADPLAGMPPQDRPALRGLATACIDTSLFPADQPDSNYLAPQVLINVNHDMEIMQQESFGPVVGIMKVNDDAQALQLMNDSAYGLTASIWTQDETRAAELGDQVQTGTVFMNRCDYLDPALAWVGVKDSGRGCSLSALGYQQLTRPKSFHLRKAVKKNR